MTATKPQAHAQRDKRETELRSLPLYLLLLQFPSYYVIFLPRLTPDSRRGSTNGTAAEVHPRHLTDSLGPIRGLAVHSANHNADKRS